MRAEIKYKLIRNLGETPKTSMPLQAVYVGEASSSYSLQHAFIYLAGNVKNKLGEAVRMLHWTIYYYYLKPEVERLFTTHVKAVSSNSGHKRYQGNQLVLRECTFIC